MIVFISSPYAGDINNNTEKARHYCRIAVDAGHIPIAPHLLFPQFMKEDTEREKALKIGLALLDLCDEMWCFGEPSSGMKIEMQYAKEHFIPVKTFAGGTE